MLNIIFILLIILFLMGLSFYYLCKRQGLSRSDRKTLLKKSNIQFDDNSIPTINDDAWLGAIEKQGLVVASERLWQMDLMRRKAQGRLSEWFGEKALSHDIDKQTDNREAVLRNAVLNWTNEDKALCEAYIAGVNRFIKEYPNRWGIEYFFLRTKPQEWTLEDTASIMMLISESITFKTDLKAQHSIYKKYLPKKWYEYFFRKSHPYNKPYFGESDYVPIRPPEEKLSKFDLNSELSNKSLTFDDIVLGSNAWAYNGSSENFLVSDPHLEHSVPCLWYAVRFKVNGEWAVGAAVPGLPGVIIGANKSLSWTFTNTGEDVLDLIEEELEASSKRIEKKTFEITVKGRTKPVVVEGLFSPEGPVKKNTTLNDGKYYSIRWLGFRPQAYGVPTLDFMKSKNWDEMNKALDRFGIISQNTLIMNKHGHIGYRISGTEIKKQECCELVINTPEDSKIKYESPDKRYRFFNKNKKILANANQRVHMKGSHNWSADWRADRIYKFLSRENLDINDMKALQSDTYSEFRLRLLHWLCDHIKPELKEEKDVVELWRSWKGYSGSLAFEDSIFIDAEIIRLIVSRINDSFLPKELAHTKRGSSMPRVIVLEAFDNPQVWESFGFTEKELATYLIKKALARRASRKMAFEVSNAWRVQHPFFNKNMMFKKIFGLKSYPQNGFYDVVKVESPDRGATFKAVFNLSSYNKSEWIFPTGQSGHIGSKYYCNFQKKWHNNKYLKVFPEDWHCENL